MGYREMLERKLFWIERMGFLITAITWSLRAFVIDSEILSYYSFMEYWVGPVILFWMCTNFLYFLLCASRLAEQAAAESMFTNLGFILERIALLYIAISPKYHDLCFLVIFPVLNIYFAWRGYSMEFQTDSSSTRIAEEQQNSSMDLCTRIEYVMFLTERLGLVILSISWFFRDKIVELIGWVLFYNGHLQFWLSTNLMYLLVSLERNFPRNHGGHWLVNNFTCHLGFWLERVALLGCSYGFTLLLHSSTYNLGIAMLHLSFSVFFPSLNFYFTWRGYSKEFLSNTVVVQELVKCGGATLEDVLSKMLRAQEESMLMKIVNAMEENRQKYLAESENHWQMMLKRIIDYKKNVEDVKGKVLNEMEEDLKKFQVKSEDSWQHFQKDFIDSNGICCTSSAIENVVGKMLRDQEEKIHMKISNLTEENHQKYFLESKRSLQHLLKDFVDIKDDSSVSKIEDVVGKLLRIQEMRIHMKLVTTLEQNRHGCMGNCEDSWHMVLKKAIENYEKYKEESEQLAWKLQLYRDLLHDSDVSIPDVSN